MSRPIMLHFNRSILHPRGHKLHKLMGWKFSCAALVVTGLVAAAVLRCAFRFVPALAADKDLGDLDDDGSVAATRAFDRPQSKCPFATPPPPVPFEPHLPLRFPRRRSTPPSLDNNLNIPPVVHFIFGYKDAHEPFGLVQYLAVASALNVLKPERIIMHHGRAPSGFYWDMVKPHVELKRARAVNHIFGNPVVHYAHKADVIRLESLLEYGGIYLDLDVWVLRPFDGLLRHEFVMGQEGVNGRIGLCNAVILASKESAFLRRWYESYRTFNGSIWNYHSVQLPGLLAKQFPRDITVMSHDTFFWPLWDARALRSMYAGHSYQYQSNLAVHTWNSAARSHLQGFSQAWLLECRSTLLSMMSAYVPRPLFSVVMPCYNQRDYIREAIDSVAGQSWPYWELIVVDDGSPDGCGEYVQGLSRTVYANVSQMQKHLTVITHRKNRGLAESRNAGIRAARGIWICALDADDRIGPDYFLQAERAMSSDPTLGVIYGDQQFFGESKWHWKVPGLDFQESLVAGPLPVMSIYRRSLWKNVGGYSSALPWGNEDWDFWLKLVEVGARSFKLRNVHTFYRYKTKSMMRDTQQESSAERAMLRTRHPDLYNAAALLEAHDNIAAMGNKTRDRLIRMSKSAPHARGESRADILFWLGLRAAWQDKNAPEAEELVREAIRLDSAESMRWQPGFVLATILCSDGRVEEAREAITSLTASTYIAPLRKTARYRELVEACAPDLHPRPDPAAG